jgi:hypothetical protein
MSRCNNKQLRNRHNKRQHARKRPLGGTKSWFRQSLKNYKFNKDIASFVMLNTLNKKEI